jgi:hypothetical protein
LLEAEPRGEKLIREEYGKIAAKAPPEYRSHYWVTALAKADAFGLGAMESASDCTDHYRRRARLAGATSLYFAERKVNPDFANWRESLWSVWVLLFSGLHQPRKTTVGRLVTMAVLVGWCSPCRAARTAAPARSCVGGCYTRPIKTSTMTISRISPSPPPG